MKVSHFLPICILLLNSFLSYAQNPTSGINKKPENTQKVQTISKNKGVHMTFDQEIIKLGKIKKGEIKKFDFVFTNSGTEIIEIDIMSGCDCTELDYPVHKILPGKKAIINVTFESGKKEDNENNTTIDLYLKNINPEKGYRFHKILKFEYEFIR